MTWNYWIEVTLAMPGSMSTNISWRVPFYVIPVSSKLLKNMFPDYAMEQPPKLHDGLGSIQLLQNPESGMGNPVESVVRGGGTMVPRNGFSSGKASFDTSKYRLLPIHNDKDPTSRQMLIDYLNGNPDPKPYANQARFNEDNISQEDTNNFGEALSFTPTFIIPADAVVIIPPTEGGAPCCALMDDR